MDPIVVELTLAETAYARRRAAAMVRSTMAVPLGLLAAGWIVLCPVALVAGRGHLGPFVGVALLVVTVLAWSRYRSVARDMGVGVRFWPWIAVALVALAGGAGASRLGAEHGVRWMNLAGPFVINALALLALARLIRSGVLAIGAALIIADSIIAAIVLNGDAAVSVQLAADALVLVAAAARLKQ